MLNTVTLKQTSLYGIVLLYTRMHMHGCSVSNIYMAFRKQKPVCM